MCACTTWLQQDNQQHRTFYIQPYDNIKLKCIATHSCTSIKQRIPQRSVAPRFAAQQRRQDASRRQKAETASEHTLDPPAHSIYQVRIDMA